MARETVTIESWQDPAMVRQGRPAPFVDFSGFASYADYRAYITKRGKDCFKKNARLRERLAEDFGELVFTLDDTSPDVLDQPAVEVEAARLQTGLPDIYAKPANVEFFHELRRRGALRSSTLRARGRLLSSWLGFVHDRVWSGWVFTFDHYSAFKKYSLGWQLMESLLEECHRSGLAGFDFSTGSSDYKLAYGTHVRVLGDVGHRPLSQQLILKLKTDAKRLLERYPRLRGPVETLARSSKQLLFRS